VLLEDLLVDPDALERRTGWTVKDEGACKADVCVPLTRDARVADGRIDVEILAQQLGMPLVDDAELGLWALGPETLVTGRALSSAVAPNLVLPTVDGDAFELASLRGQKVLLVAWASW
jgi:hypothetical protein